MARQRETERQKDRERERDRASELALDAQLELLPFQLFRLLPFLNLSQASGQTYFATFLRSDPPWTGPPKIHHGYLVCNHHTSLCKDYPHHPGMWLTWLWLQAGEGPHPRGCPRLRQAGLALRDQGRVSVVVSPSGQVKSTSSELRALERCVAGGRVVEVVSTSVK